MHDDDFDASSFYSWEDELPKPNWDLVAAWVDSRDPNHRREAWNSVLRQWLGELGVALGGGFEVIESANVMALLPRGSESPRSLLPFAERCRVGIATVLRDVVDFESQGKQVAMILRSPDEYYRYLSLYYGEGEYGGSTGVHVREGYSHVVLYGKTLATLENTLAHEMTHVALHHLTMPQWLEEGLAQMFEHNMTGRQLLEVTAEIAARHKKHWTKYGLDDFWRGEGFHRSGKIQELSYQLAEILIRLLAEEYRPRWFGLVKEPQKQLFAFLREAHESDCGQQACQAHLKCELSDLAAKFLGPGEWSPGL